MAATQKILLIQLFSNGDCLYATTVARQIKNDFPGCHLSWAIADYCKDIIRNNPYIDETVIVPDINFKNWKQHWKAFEKKVAALRVEKKYDQVFFTQIIADNYVNYDYGIRSAIFRNAGIPITVPVQPILSLTDTELETVKIFAERHSLASFKQVVLFEFAPRSGQAKFTKEMALDIADHFTNDSGVAFIMSSSIKLETGKQSIIDGSVLSLRETAALSHFCTLMIGCSSGITWVTTTSAGRKLPMIQILDPDTYWVNSVVNDHERFGLPTDHIIEITNTADNRIQSCISHIFEHGFGDARAMFHTPVAINFKVSRGIVAYFMGRFRPDRALKHIMTNISLYGYRQKLLKSAVLGFITFPVTNVINHFKEKKQ